MRRSIYISFWVVVTLMCGCQDFDEQQSPDREESTSRIVEVLEDGRMRVQVSLNTFDMSDVELSSRAAIADEEAIASGWCLVFGEDAVDQDTPGAVRSMNNPLLLRMPLTVATTGEFFVTLPFYEGAAFLRIVTNLTQRENEMLESAVCWADQEGAYKIGADGIMRLSTPTAEQIAPLTTFQDYAYQSVGLDGIYPYPLDADNKSTYTTTVNVDETATDINGVTSYVYENNTNITPPDPNSVDPFPKFPMSSPGFVLEGGLSEESLNEVFDKKVYMVRVCSKMNVTISDNDFLLKEVYMIDCAQEARLRSTVLTSSDEPSDQVDYTFDIPVDLGGAIDYAPLLEEKRASDDDPTTSPIYFYPNSGGNYSSNGGAVNKSVNPQYVIIKGRAGGYDTDGYYKIALKAQYPMEYEYNADGTIATNEDGTYKVVKYSQLTYDILRNTHFNIDLTTVDKPGYKTFEDARSDDNPASNISYSIVITSLDGRNEILVSNGTFCVELNSTRVYMAGYGEAATTPNAGAYGKVSFTIYPNPASEDYVHPAAYIMGDYGVNIESVTANGVAVDKTDWSKADDDAHVHDYWFKVAESSNKTEVEVNFSATNSGRIRMRIGDILKFIPVRYVSSHIPYQSGKLVISDEDDFSYDAITYLGLNDTNLETSGAVLDWFGSDGVVAINSTDDERELRAQIYPKASDGITKVYFKQGVNVPGDDRDEGIDGTGNASGNIIYTDDTTGGVPFDDYDALYAAVKKMLEDGYTTIYVDGATPDALFNKGFAYSKSVFFAVATELAATEAKYFSVDMTGFVNTNNTNIGQFQAYFFQKNIYIQSVILPSSIEVINDNAFADCTGLQSVRMGGEGDFIKPTSVSGNVQIKSSAFWKCTSLKNVTIYSKNEGLTIGTSAFFDTPILNETFVATQLGTDQYKLVRAVAE